MAHSVTKIISIEGKEYKIHIGCPFFVPHYESNPFDCAFNVLVNDIFQGRIRRKDGLWEAIDDFIHNWQGEVTEYAFLFTEAADFQALGEMIENSLNN